jgi:hypothetical protein
MVLDHQEAGQDLHHLPLLTAEAQAAVPIIVKAQVIMIMVLQAIMDPVEATAVDQVVATDQVEAMEAVDQTTVLVVPVVTQMPMTQMSILKPPLITTPERAQSTQTMKKLFLQTI